MTMEEFLTKLKQIADEYEWGQVGDWIRANVFIPDLEESVLLCPLQVMHYHVYGESDYWGTAGKRLGLNVGDKHDIASAADNPHEHGSRGCITDEETCHRRCNLRSQIAAIVGVQL